VPTLHREATLHREDGHVLQLTDRDFVASGGQGTVYIVGNTAHKVVFDSDQALSADRRDRLRALCHPAVVRPEQLLFHPDGRPAGHTMPAVSGTPWLGLVPGSAWRARGVDPAAAVGLCGALAEAVAAVHRDGAVVGDLNPLNILVHDNLRGLWLIDTDSWGIGPWPASAVLPAVADPRMGARPSTGSDWFGVAVNAVQLLTGLHPFRGRHPQVKGLAARARAGLWALDSQVRCPPATRPLAGLDRAWRDWLEAVLTTEHRGPPPGLPRCSGTVAVPGVPSGAGELVVRTVHQAEAPLRGLVAAGAGLVAWTAEQVLWSGSVVGAVPPGLATVVAVGEGLVGIGLQGGRLVVQELGAAAPVPLAVEARAVGSMAGQAVVLAGDGLFALKLLRVGGRLHAGLDRLGSAHPRAAVLYDGVMVSILAGASWIALSPGSGQLVQLRVPELDGCRVVAAAARGRVVLVLARRQGRVDRLRLRFGRSWDRHDAHWTEDVGQHELELARLPSGVVVHTDESGDLVIVPEGMGLPGERRVVTGGRAPAALLAGAGGLVGIEGDAVVGLSLG
jgi:hypothetical protein